MNLFSGVGRGGICSFEFKSFVVLLPPFLCLNL